MFGAVDESAKTSQTPGPGAYGRPLIPGPDAPKYSLAKRLDKPMRRSSTPGPGAVTCNDTNVCLVLLIITHTHPVFVQVATRAPLRLDPKWSPQSEPMLAVHLTSPSDLHCCQRVAPLDQVSASLTHINNHTEPSSMPLLCLPSLPPSL